ncbi:hypothetical protein [Kingella denitrificans]|uniref:hypothetical protein n=1 Tax=Kingella denitrificans TaxID=502 RepID=UPI0011D12D64|nr:hypothetical protein [Kingella denitrificans]
MNGRRETEKAACTCHHRSPTADMALRRHTHAFGLPPVAQVADNIQISPLPRKRGREDGRRKHIKKQPALGFLKVQAAFSDSAHEWVQAAFYALCYAAYAANYGTAATCSLSHGRGLG